MRKWLIRIAISLVVLGVGVVGFPAQLGKVPISDPNSKPSMFKRATDKTKNVLEDAGESVKGVFKRIFDK